MDVDGLNAAVLNPDLRLENTEQQGRRQGVKNLSLSLTLSFLPGCERSETAYHWFQSRDANLTPAKVKVIPAREQLTWWLAALMCEMCNTWFMIRNSQSFLFYFIFFYFLHEQIQQTDLMVTVYTRNWRDGMRWFSCNLSLWYSQHNTFSCSSYMLCSVEAHWEPGIYKDLSPKSTHSDWGKNCRKLVFLACVYLCLPMNKKQKSKSI